MKKAKILFLGIACSLILGGCVKPWANAKDLESLVEEVSKLDLPDPGAGAVYVEARSDQNNAHVAIATADAATGRNRAESYGSALVSAGFEKLTDRSNTVREGVTQGAVTVFNAYRQKNKLGQQVHVEVSGGDLTKTNGVYQFGISTGFGIKVMNYDNAIVTQEKWRSDLNYQTVRRYGDRQIGDPNTLGTQKNLIVPLEFQDRTFDDLPGGWDKMKNYIDLGLNGDSDDTNWESLKSFYHKSSYGQLNIESDFINLGAGVETFTYSKTLDETIMAQATTYANGGHVMFDILHELTTHLIYNVYGSINNYNEAMKPYDIDANRLIDNIWIIYPFCSQPSRKAANESWFKNRTQYYLLDQYGQPILDGYGNPTENPNYVPGYADAADNVFWAYTHHVYNNNAGGTITSPYTFAVMSWDMMFEEARRANGEYIPWTDTEIANGVALVDSRTFIHEHGHVLSMPDYYSYDYNNDSPLGGLDMMDHNVGDHGAYNKINYNWIMPRVVNHPVTVTLQAHQISGDVIVLPAKNGWKDTMIDEYLVLEYVTPTGLNQRDSQYRYRESYPRHFQTGGLKVVHVDSRLGVFDYSSGSSRFVRHTDSLTSAGNNTLITIAADNTATRSVSFSDRNNSGTTSTARLAQLLRPNGTLQLKGNATSETVLFTDTTAQFGQPGVFNNWYLNNQSLFGWSFTITAMDATSMTIQFK